MESLDLVIDARWAIGVLLAVTRVAAFVIASPQLGKAVPAPARLAFAIAIGWFLATAVDGQLPDMGEEFSAARIVALTGLNAAVGVVMGWMLGVLFHLFAMAGSIIDVSAGTSIASVLDPTRGEQGAVFSRMFQIGGLALFHAVGGLSLLVTTLVWSVRAVPLTGAARLGGGALASVATSLTSRLMIASVEIALPVFAVLMLTEMVLGLAARFAPTANVFLLGLPAKTFLALTTAGMSVALFPEAIDGLLSFSRTTAIEVLNGIGVA